MFKRWLFPPAPGLPSIFRLCRFRTIARDPKNGAGQDQVSLCVVGNGADGNPRSVFLQFGERIFMFNCGEGVQRLIADLGLAFELSGH